MHVTSIGPTAPQSPPTIEPDLADAARLAEQLDRHRRCLDEARVASVAAAPGRVVCPACEGHRDLAPCMVCGDRGTIPLDPAKRLLSACRCSGCNPDHETDRLAHSPARPSVPAIADPRHELTVRIALESRRVATLASMMADACAKIDTDPGSLEAAAELVRRVCERGIDAARRLDEMAARAHKIDMDALTPAPGRRTSDGAHSAA